MGDSIPQLVLLLLAAGVVGAVAALLIGNALGKRRLIQLKSEAEARLDELTRQRDQYAAELSKAQATAESRQTEVAAVRGSLESAVHKSKVLARNVLLLRTEREDTKAKVGTLQKALTALKQQTAALQKEFDKASHFYKGELRKSFNKRKILEEELETARLEQDSFTRLVESSVLEHGSPKEMITAAQLRLGQIEVLERNIRKLEVENAELREDAARLKRECGELQGELAKMEELRINNQQLVRCVESLENRRKEHEQDADRYRDQANQSEKMSETLRLKLDDLEKSFADMERQQQSAIAHARQATEASG